MGDRVLYNGDGLSNANADVPGRITWAEWEQGADLHTDAAIAFIQAAHAAGKPFYVHVPYNDTHSPYDVDPGHENDFDHITTNTNGKLFLGELHALDEQIGRLVAAVDDLGIAEETLILVIGDNGAPNDTINAILTRNGGLRGGKGTLWEGGIREPFMVRMPGTVPSGVVNETTAVSTLDLFPTYCALAGLPLPAAPFAGENQLDVFKGSDRARERPLFWEYGTSLPTHPGSPLLAVREGDWKFLCDPDGSERALYDLSRDREETRNLVDDAAYAEKVARLEAMLIQWYQEIVRGEIGESYVAAPGEPAGLVVADDYDLSDHASEATGFGTGSGVNEDLGSRLSGMLASSLSYVQTNVGKAASAHSITDDRLTIAEAANPTAFQFSADGTTAYDFGPHLAGRRYEWRVVMDYDDGVVSEPRMTLGIADSASPAAGVGDHDLGIQLDLVSGNTVSVFKRMDANSQATGADINAAIATGLPMGEPVTVRVLIDEAEGDLSYPATYEIWVNGQLVDSGEMVFGNASRYLIFDTAPNVGPASYDDFALETLDQGRDRLARVPVVGVSETEVTPLDGVEHARVYWTTQPGQTVGLWISRDLVSWEPVTENGEPVEVSTEYGTIRWQDVTIPEGFRERSFVRLETVD
ncbi:hypothetical protein HNR46_004029 [Haloferula luteola]|uniref:Sulfatase N-terminal domain-containing protein n=1 Tax=Haloferula luteola TaxID=595692 RepID=A0A840V680_9BACT|nr:sulfatase-like hydrolase/transferase [Haloferula luteola]MBB5353767.1 hypothetical protein [Haloferula luteola]